MTRLQPRRRFGKAHLQITAFLRPLRPFFLGSSAVKDFRFCAALSFGVNPTNMTTLDTRITFKKAHLLISAFLRPLRPFFLGSSALKDFRFCAALSFGVNPTDMTTLDAHNV